MKTTYNEILNSMKTVFYNECGENVESLSDLGARFEAVASELFSISCYGDFILKQAFPQTAGGEYLDFHADLRGIRRKTPSKARGTLTFSILEPVAYEIEIPSGTICAVKDSPYIQFATDENAVIPAGELSVDVNATAVAEGGDYNAAGSTVTVMVNPPMGVTAVSNRFRFNGGYSGESDASLRKRILNIYKIPQKGIGFDMLKNAVNDIDEVLDCNIVKGESSCVNVYVRCRERNMSLSVQEKIRNKLALFDVLEISLNIYDANPKMCKFSIDVKANEDVEQEISDIITDYIISMRVGEELKLNQLAGLISAVDGIEYCSVTSDATNSNTLVCSKDEYITLSGIEVSYDD